MSDARKLRVGRLCCVMLLTTVAAGAPIAGVSAGERDEGGDDRMALLAQAGHEDDADEFGGSFARAGVLVDYASPLQHAGFAVQDAHYAQDGWSEDVVGVVGLYRRQRRDTLEGVRAEAGVVSVGGKVRPIGDVTFTLRPRATTGVELIAAGDVVTTRAAIERSISYGLAAASVEQQFGERITAVGLAGWQPFTDGNARALFRARLVYAVAPEAGLSAQIRWRQYASRDEDVGGAYFNPETYRNWDAGFAWRRRLDGGWTLAGLAGLGRERIESRSWQTTHAGELRAEGPIGRENRLSLGFAYSRAAGFNAAKDYWYGSFNVAVTLPLR